MSIYHKLQQYSKALGNRAFTLGSALVAIVLLTACSPRFDNNNYILDYRPQDSRDSLYHKILNARQQGLSIVVLGDSHVAADIMTGALRSRLQSYYGKGLPGFIEPAKVSGQANQVVSYEGKGLTLINARTTRDYDYRLGGYVASFTKGDTQTYNFRNYNLGVERLRINARCTTSPTCLIKVESGLAPLTFRLKGTAWQAYTISVKDFIKITAFDNLEIAGLYLPNKGEGVTVTSLGSNGATLQHLNLWATDWTKELAILQPDLVILAYGTNESYFSNFNTRQYRQEYRDIINRIRRDNPRTAIMVVSNPDTLNLGVNSRLANGPCRGQQHKNSDLVHRTLLTIANENKTLYWDWREAMGGQCSMLYAIKKGKGLSDGVHFSFKAYQEFGNKLALDLINHASEEVNKKLKAK